MGWNRKEYDKLRARKIYEEFKERRLRLIKDVFNDQCYVCHDEAEQGFHFHHVEYYPDSNYPRHSKSMNVRLKRLSEAEQYPERFRLLCGACHLMAERIAHKVSDMKRLLEVVNVVIHA